MMSALENILVLHERVKEEHGNQVQRILGYLTLVYSNSCSSRLLQFATVHACTLK